VLFLVLHGAAGEDGNGGADSDTRALRQRCQEAISQHLNPLFRLDRVIVAPSLPINASNKVMRRVLRDQVQAAERQTAKL